MKSPKFQILVHGDKVGECNVNISDERVKLIKTINLENPNYIVLGIQILERSEEHLVLILNFLRREIVRKI